MGLTLPRTHSATPANPYAKKTQILAEHKVYRFLEFWKRVFHKPPFETLWGMHLMDVLMTSSLGCG